MAWVLILFMVAANGGAASLAVDMASYDQCSAARTEAMQQDGGSRDGNERVVKLAFCVKRNG